MPLEVTGPSVSPTPAEAPSAPAPAAESTPASSTSFSNDQPDIGPQGEDAGARFVLDAFDQMQRGEDDVPPPSARQVSEPSAPIAQPQPVTPQAPQQPAPVEPAPAAAVAPAPAAPAPVAPQPAVAPQAQQPGEALDPFETMRANLAQHEPQFRQALADQMYKIDQKDMDAFLSGDSKVVSHALARVHMNTVGSIMAVLSQQMPVWVNTLVQRQNGMAEAENRFWQANAHLDKSKHRHLVGPIAKTYRNSVPTADEATVHKMVGMLVAAAAGINLPNGQVPVAPQAPQAPVVRTPGPQVRQVSPPAYAPAGVQSVAPRNASGGPENPWALMTEIFMADQRGELDNVR